MTPEPDLLALAVEQSFNAVVITDADFGNGGPLIQYANRAFCEMTGYALDELRGRSPRILQGADTDPAVIERLRRCLREGSFFVGSTVNYRKDGSAYIVEWNISAVRDQHGTITHYISVQSNITERIRAENERTLLTHALDLAGAPILITRRDGVIVFVNKAFERQTGYSAAEACGQTPRLLRSGQHDAAFYHSLWTALANGEAFRATFTNQRKDGSVFHAEQTLAPLRDASGQLTHFVSVSKDLTERVQQERNLHEIAQRDPLTGLLNRRGGDQALTALHAEAQARATPFSLILADIDHFKQINDRHGHPAGDRVLASVAAVLQRCVRSTDRVVRWGGEEFLLLLPGASAAAAQRLAERIRSQLATQHDAAAGAVTLSLGVAELQADESAAALVARADQALYAAKAAGRDRVVQAA